MSNYLATIIVVSDFIYGFVCKGYYFLLFVFGIISYTSVPYSDTPSLTGNRCGACSKRWQRGQCVSLSCRGAGPIWPPSRPRWNVSRRCSNLKQRYRQAAVIVNCTRPEFLVYFLNFLSMRLYKPVWPYSVGAPVATRACPRSFILLSMGII